MGHRRTCGDGPFLVRGRHADPPAHFQPSFPGRQRSPGSPEKTMKILLFLSFLALLPALLHPAAVQAQGRGQTPAEYRVGERLATDKAGPQAYRQIDWDDLLPRGWDPMAAFRGLDLARLKDSDPKAREALEKMRSAWDQAPVETALNGQKVRIAGFVVPLERKGEQILEFLLVPYFGACIHVPPPPANQIIHVIPDKPVSGMKTMDAMWVSGTLKLDRAETAMGVSGYRLRGEVLAAYTRPKS
jgi:hypothetical protein